LIIKSTLFCNDYQFVQHLRKIPQFDIVKIVGVSATVRKRELKKQFHDICDDFIPKPVDNDLLFNKMKNILHLEWIYDNTPEKTNKIVTGELFFPDNNIIQQITEHAEIGDFNSINELVNNLIKENSAYENFCMLIKKHAKNYSSEGILSILEQNKKLAI